jgi:hypothetical protein
MKQFTTLFNETAFLNFKFPHLGAKSRVNQYHDIFRTLVGKLKSQIVHCQIMLNLPKADGIKVSVYRHLKCQKLMWLFFIIHYFSRFEFVKFWTKNSNFDRKKSKKILMILEGFASFWDISYVFDSVS